MTSAAALSPLAVSMGEPAGVGTEVLLKAYAALRAGEAPAGLSFFLLDDPVRVRSIAAEVMPGVRIVSIGVPGDAASAFADGLPVLPPEGIDPETVRRFQHGTPSVTTAPAVAASIARAAALALSGAAGGVVTLPIQKAVLQAAGFPHPGHTEYLGELTEQAPMPAGAPRGPIMMLAAGDFRTIPVTVHEPLRKVPGLLTIDRIVDCARVAASSLRRDFGIASPRLALAGLNPHAGEGGLMGREENDVIEPAIAHLQAEGIDAQGPFPADTLFHDEARAGYDAALCMYHDQALIPIKTIAFHEAVNVTIGLPIIRTSPDHGTALAIAGKGVARADSTMAAILIAHRMAASRSSSHA